MKHQLISSICLMAAAWLACTSAFAQEPEQEEPTLEELAAKEADRLENLLDLEYWQVFYVDSTLQHDFKYMMEEVEQFKKSGVSNPDMYVRIQDKWMARIDSTYATFFTASQWKAYLKSGAAKMQKQREKRRQQGK